MARKNFVLDTNVLLHDPRALYAFADNHVIIPIYVLEEIDSFKKDQSDLGRNAREVARQLDNARALGRLSEGVPIGHGDGGRLRGAMGTGAPRGAARLPAARASARAVAARSATSLADRRHLHPGRGPRVARRRAAGEDVPGD